MLNENSKQIIIHRIQKKLSKETTKRKRVFFSKTKKPSSPAKTSKNRVGMPPFVG